MSQAIESFYKTMTMLLHFEKDFDGVNWTFLGR